MGVVLFGSRVGDTYSGDFRRKRMDEYVAERRRILLPMSRDDFFLCVCVRPFWCLCMFMGFFVVILTVTSSRG